ncbi:MAG: LptF/LptG family permease [Chlamydiae bacterium]|nr:LptF/LptG family permease [Chlamydiota bacterium]
MPIFWRYLLSSYFKVLSLCIGSFIAVLLVLKLRDIAEFASCASSIISVILFTIYQIPQILPYALSISALISSIILFQRLSLTNELTALRANGLSLKMLLTPLFFASLFLSIFNFYVVSELAPRSYFKSKEIFFEQTSINPLTLLQRQNASKIKNSHIEMKSPSNNQIVEDVLMVIPNHANQRLSFLLAKELLLKEDLLTGNQVAIISHAETKNPQFFDSLIIENQKQMTIQASVLSDFMKSRRWQMLPKGLPLRMLLVRSELDKNSVKHHKHNKDNIKVEIARRVAIAFSTVTFTFLGACFSIQIGRLFSKKSIYIASILSLMILISFTIGKALRHNIFLSIIAYSSPQVLVLLLVKQRLKKISRGAE